MEAMQLTSGNLSVSSGRSCRSALPLPYKPSCKGMAPGMQNSCNHGCTSPLLPVTQRPTAAFSVYPLTELRRAAGSNTSKGPGGAMGSHAWLADCVRHIVSSIGQLGRGPMLQLVFSTSAPSAPIHHRFVASPVDQSVADDPQNWHQLAAHVRNSGANGLVLVRPIASPEQHCIYAAPSSQRTSSPASCQPPTAAGPCPTAAAAAAACYNTAAAAGAATTTGSGILAGQVGACCDDGARQDIRTVSPAGSAAGTPHCPLASSGTSTPQYYGLVVQGIVSSEADGCWVLKTTRSNAVDCGGGEGTCACVHFCLTRVCLGQPLYEQLRDAWLVQPSRQAA